jgi:hypothetical protein
LFSYSSSSSTPKEIFYKKKSKTNIQSYSHIVGWQTYGEVSYFDRIWSILFWQNMVKYLKHNNMRFMLHVSDAISNMQLKVKCKWRQHFQHIIQINYLSDLIGFHFWIQVIELRTITYQLLYCIVIQANQNRTSQSNKLGGPWKPVGTFIAENPSLVSSSLFKSWFFFLY